jgi:hypothetical protein
MSTELMEKADEILNKVELPDRHSFFQIEKFMVGKEPTAQAQLWAISREIGVRKETIDQLDKELADAEDSLELFDIRTERLNRAIREMAKLKEPDIDLNIQEHEINIRKLMREKESLIKAARKVNKRRKCVMEELAYLVAGYEQIVEKIGDMKPYDDEESQKEMWNEKLLEEFNLRIILQRPLDPEFVRTVMCLHDEAPVKKHVVSLIENIQQKMLAERQVQAKRPSVEVRPRIVGN